MTRKWFWSALLALTLTAALQGQSRESVLKQLAQTPDWTPADKPAAYNEKDIQDLVGRRAPAIVRYGVMGATRQTWKGPAGTVRITLYEMVDPSAAYGWFTLERNINQPGFVSLPYGTEAFRVGNRSSFWQSKYVVSLEGSESASESAARLISENIFGRSKKPPVSSLLPPANLVQGSDKYIVEGSGMGPGSEVNPEEFGFEDSVEVATADYLIDGKIAHLFLLLYPTQQIAKKYGDQWDGKNSGDAAFRKRIGAILALVRGTKDPAVAKSILDGVNYETQVTWNEPRPDISLRDVILTIFSFIGIALIFTVVIGLSFGGFRVFVKGRYPGMIFDRPEEMEIIQLKLDQGFRRNELKEKN
jgi:uncharacterized protein DUF6599